MSQELEQETAKKKIQTVIFDLDGTLLNTIADLAISTNYALHRCGFPKHREEEYFHFVGNGITKLFERALPEECRSSCLLYTSDAADEL